VKKIEGNRVARRMAYTVPDAEIEGVVWTS
jgi:hypothetical protein